MQRMSSSEESFDLTQDVDDVVVLTASKKSTPNTPVAGTSKKTGTVRKRKSKVPDFITGLKALTVSQLVDMIGNVITKHPEIKNDFIGLTPTPDLEPLQNKLEILKKNIYKAFPYSKYGSDRDAFCYRRVKVHLQAFQRECFEQCKCLIDSQQWKSSIDYIVVAWQFVYELPDWNEPKHNNHKNQCFKKLMQNLTNALKKGTFAEQELQTYIQKFRKLNNDYKDKENGIQNCITLAENILGKLK